MTNLKNPRILISLALLLTTGACSVDEGRPAAIRGRSTLGLSDLMTTGESSVLGRWQGATMGGPSPGEPCTLDVSPTQSGDLSQVQFELSTATGRKIYTTVSQGDALAIFSGETRLIQMRPQSVSDWLDLARNKLTSLAYAKLLAAYEFVASLIRRDPSAAGSVVLRSALIQWSILRSVCHFETRWTFDESDAAQSPRISGTQNLTCLYQDQPPGIFSLDHIQCQGLRRD